MHRSVTSRLRILFKTQSVASALRSLFSLHHSLLNPLPLALSQYPFHFRSLSLPLLTPFLPSSPAAATFWSVFGRSHRGGDTKRRSPSNSSRGAIVRTYCTVHSAGRTLSKRHLCGKRSRFRLRPPWFPRSPLSPTGEGTVFSTYSTRKPFCVTANVHFQIRQQNSRCETIPFALSRSLSLCLSVSRLRVPKKNSPMINFSSNSRTVERPKEKNKGRDIHSPED